jgi:hypothetical protein
MQARSQLNPENSKNDAIRMQFPALKSASANARKEVNEPRSKSLGQPLFELIELAGHHFSCLDSRCKCIASDSGEVMLPAQNFSS